jgi:hypothetical protein
VFTARVRARGLVVKWLRSAILDSPHRDKRKYIV